MKRIFEYWGTVVPVQNLDDLAPLIEKLNELGYKGWELVHITLQAKPFKITESQFKFFWEILLKRKKTVTDEIN